MDTKEKPQGVISLDERRDERNVTVQFKTMESHLLAFEKDEVIPITAGEESAYIIRSGRVAVRRDVQTTSGMRSANVSIIERGDSFNDAHLFDLSMDDERLNTYVALTPVELIVLPGSSFERHAQKPQLLYSFIRSKVEHEAKMRNLVTYLVQKFHESNVAQGTDDAEINVEAFFLLVKSEQKLKAVEEENAKLRSREAHHWNLCEQVFQRYGITDREDPDIRILLGIDPFDD